MKKNKLSLFVFVDALGWEVLQRNYPVFLEKEAPYRKPLRTILGYSSACDPSIISGLTPAEHGMWTSFYYSPKTSPFGYLEILGVLPPTLTDYHRVRSKLSAFVAWFEDITGYFQLYNLPFKYFGYFDYAEKKNIFQPGGLIHGRSIFDLAVEQKVTYYVNPLHQTDQMNLKSLQNQISKGEISFAYITLGKLDALMHSVGPTHADVTALLKWYEEQIQQLLDLASNKYEDVSLYVFSDHGMHAIEKSVDLQARIASLSLRYGEDYVALYDSTMARFWFLKPGVRELVMRRLSMVPEGRVLTEDELIHLGIYFPDHRYGELVFLLEGGALIIPSFMGKKRIAGMHGYHPDEKDSYAALMASNPIPDETREIQQIFNLMLSDTGLRNSSLV